MKKIMFMMMPLFLTALIFGAGCDQDPSTTKDTGNSGGGDVVADVTIQAKDNDAELSIDKAGILHSEDASVTQADWDAIKTVRFITAKSENAKGTLKVKELKDDETYPVFVPADKTLILSGDGEITAKTTVVVEGNLYVENGSLLVGTETSSSQSNYYSEGRIVLKNNGVLRLYDGTTLKYGDKAKVTSILKDGISALKNGGIEFRTGSTLDLQSITSSSSDFILMKTAPNEEDDKYITLDDVYQYSKPASVKIMQGTVAENGLTSDYIINYPVTTDRTLYVDGGANPPPETFESEAITIPAGLDYTNIRTYLEHKAVTVNGTLKPGRPFYASTITIGPGAVYDNSGHQTDIDYSLVVRGNAEFNVLNLTNPIPGAPVTVDTGGVLTIGSEHKFNYSPTINGTLILKAGGNLLPGYNINVTDGKFTAGDFTLQQGSLIAPASVSGDSPNPGGRVTISPAGAVVLEGNARLEVANSLSVAGAAKVSAGSLALTNYSGEDRIDALTLQNITLNGAFVLSGVGTDSAQIRATGDKVEFGAAGDDIDSAFTGNIVFTHELENNYTNTDKSFIFTGKKLSTTGNRSSLILQGGELMFGGKTLETSVSLAGGTYSVDSGNASPTGELFSLGELSSEKIGIFIGPQQNSYNSTLNLSPASSIRFALSPLSDRKAYLLVGAGAGNRLISYDYNDEKNPPAGAGVEPSLFAISGTLNENLAGPSIRIDNVIIAGSLGAVTSATAAYPVPLFTYNTETLGGTAAIGNITVIDGDPGKRIGGGGGSLTVDHHYRWRYTANGWEGYKSE
jgi:hypothetical protein